MKIEQTIKEAIDHLKNIINKQFNSTSTLAQLNNAISEANTWLNLIDESKLNAKELKTIHDITDEDVNNIYSIMIEKQREALKIERTKSGFIVAIFKREPIENDKNYHTVEMGITIDKELSVNHVWWYKNDNGTGCDEQSLYNHHKITEYLINNGFIQFASINAELDWGEDNAWPVRDVLLKLVEASEILLSKHDYDGHGHEAIRHCIDRAKEITAPPQDKTKG